MRILFFIPFILMFLTSLPSWALTMSELVKSEGVYYKKFSDTPFAREVEGRYQGKFKNGKRDGYSIQYWPDGSLFQKGNWKDGKKEGSHTTFTLEGDVWKDLTGIFKNGVKVSN